MKQKHRKSWALALGGVFGALAVAVMLLGAVIPLAMFIAPAFAGLLVMFACAECGPRMAVTLYTAISILSILFVPDKEVALVFVGILGYWPLIKPRYDTIRSPALRALAKSFTFILAILAIYSLVFVLFPATQISDDLKEAGLALTAATLLVGNIAFLLYDKAMASLLRLYRLVWQPKLHHMLGG
ncbi:MAG: hypothetical protein LKJ90_03525 [Faecalibacterium sp.]|nr:hypothetical protein [Faecalibacterium sp.]